MDLLNYFEPGVNFSLRGDPIVTSAREAYSMLGKESLWHVATRCHELFDSAQIPYSIAGGVAVCLHGYQRNTTDIDLIIHADDSQRVREFLVDSGFEWLPEKVEFRSPQGIAVQFLIAGHSAGRNTGILVPAPTGELNVEQKEGLNVVRLSKLIEMKIACGTASLRRTHKDFADVVELIAIRQLDPSFARHLHKSLRKTFKELVRVANDYQS